MFSGKTKDMINPELVQSVDLLIDGPFIETKKDNSRVLLGSTNKNLSFIKRGFSITKESLRDKELLEYIQKENDELKYVDSNFRLYASDKVFNYYDMIVSNFQRYSYASENGPRLFENSKEDFGKFITILSRFMQEDLGYRDYDKTIVKIECPKCGFKHDIISDCKCGLSFLKLPEELANKVKEEQEKTKK